MPQILMTKKINIFLLACILFISIYVIIYLREINRKYSEAKSVIADGLATASLIETLNKKSDHATVEREAQNYQKRIILYVVKNNIDDSPLSVTVSWQKNLSHYNFSSEEMKSINDYLRRVNK